MTRPSVWGYKVVSGQEQGGISQLYLGAKHLQQSSQVGGHVTL